MAPASTTGKVNATSVNLRADASSAAAVLAVLPQGTPVTIVTPNDDDSWVMVDALVRDTDQFGWLRTEFITLDGMSDPATQILPGAGVTNPAFPGVLFTALVPGGFFSAEPGNVRIRRSVRTNNPGAINDTKWQHELPGYVGKTFADNAGNVTAIYSAPEYGIAAWYVLLSERYRLRQAGGAFTILQLAHNYAGGDASQDAIDAYVVDWCRLGLTPLTPQSVIHLTDDQEMLNLGRAVFRHEAGEPLKINNDQILFGIQKQRANAMPAPPKPP